MFVRLVSRGLWQRKSRALVAVLALSLAATLTSALLNLYVDAQRKIQSEFRRYGANLMITPHVSSEGTGTVAEAELLPVSFAQQMEEEFVPQRIESVVPYLYAVVEVSGESVVLAGTWLDQFARLGGFEVRQGSAPAQRADGRCWAGISVAERFKLGVGDRLELSFREAVHSCAVAGVLATGQAEDSQILVNLAAVQALTGSGQSLNVILARAIGEAADVVRTVEDLSAALPAASVSPLRQITESEFRIVDRIRRVAAGTTLVVLVITALCVLATMTALALERQRTVGTLKALGASNRRIGLLFLSEAVLMALVAALVGFGAGVGLAFWLGEALFAADVSIRWVTLPWVIGVTVTIALVGTLFPVRLVRQTQPAVILRGE